MIGWSDVWGTSLNTARLILVVLLAIAIVFAVLAVLYMLGLTIVLVFLALKDDYCEMRAARKTRRDRHASS